MAMNFSTDYATIAKWLEQTGEFARILRNKEEFPTDFFLDVRDSLKRVEKDVTVWFSEEEISALMNSLQTIINIVAFFQNMKTDSGKLEYPALASMADEIKVFPMLVEKANAILDKSCQVKDNASRRLADIRKDKAEAVKAITRNMQVATRDVQAAGLIGKDTQPSLRDGHMLIPVGAGNKRKIKGTVHGDSGSGKTVFIEPEAVAEASNRLRELESDERREVIKILIGFTDLVRPHIADLMHSYCFMGEIDFIRAKAAFAVRINGVKPTFEDKQQVEWVEAIHPLLNIQLRQQNKQAFPLDIRLNEKDRLLIVSGANAGGKSLCLKTVVLLQYMLQCGLSIPVSERSKTGVFRDVMIDIGDEQSIENDLSTYSSHLLNMKNMMRQAGNATLLLIDEFGTGTEPQIGGAMAEAVLCQFVKKHAWGVITTHYQNLKHFADSHEGIANGAMLYDRHEMRPLFQLAIGQPGSSFAIEIARKTGIPDEVIRQASDIVGSDYIQSDKYLQDIVRDKRYWENKRQNVHQREKDLEKTIAKYEEEIKELDRKRKEILRQAKEQAQELLKESNRNIENTIREIRECQAEKEETKRLREELNAFKTDVNEIDTKQNDDLIEKKMRQIMERKERREKRKKEKKENSTKPAATQAPTLPSATPSSARQAFAVGDTVRMRGLTTVGTVETTDGKQCTVVFGDVRTKVPSSRLEHTTKPVESSRPATFGISRETRQTIDSHKLNFHQDLDVRGMRGDEALNAVQHFIDDAILVGMSRVRILHGKGTGALKEEIRKYLRTVDLVASAKDEHEESGGAGITVVRLEL